VNMGRTISYLAVIGFILSMTVWFMSEQKNTKLRGELFDKAAAEAASNIKFLQTGSHDAAVKDVADDAMQEITTGGRPQLDSRWLMNITAPGVVKIKDSRLIDLKKLITMIETYNADLSYQTYADSSSGDDEDEGSYRRTPPPAKAQMIDEFNRFISVLKEAKEHSNNLDF
jgi:hypothetical protein